MTFDIEINGHGRTISIERATAGRYRVIVDGHAQLVDATRVGSFGLSLLFDGADRSSREIQVAPGRAPGEMLVGIDGKSVVAVVNGRRSGHAGADGGAHAHGEQAVVAPMPGRVVRLLVAGGDAVTARQPIVVVEAMKMENELRASGPATVADVKVAPGALVEANAVVRVLE